MRLRVALLVLLLLRLALAQPVVHKCTTDCIKNTQGCEIYGGNNYGVEVTITVTATLENMISTQPLPYTVTIPPHSQVLLLRLKQDDPSRSWRYNYNTHWCWGSVDAVHDDSVVYRLPYAPGEAFPIIQGYHGTFSHFDDNAYGLDFSMPDGTPVHCARAGVVADTEDRYTQGGNDETLGGNYVLIKHDDGTIAEYFHLSPGGVRVQEGDRVEPGDLIGYSGHTGYADGPHLHFMVFRALDGFHRQSVPTVFEVEGEGEPVQLRQGRAYRCPGELVPAGGP